MEISNFIQSANIAHIYPQQVAQNKNLSKNLIDRFSLGHNTSVPIAPVLNPNSLPINEIYPANQLINFYSNEICVKEMIKKNPNITKMFEEKGLPVIISPENVKSLITKHVSTTNAYAMQIANEMNLSQADKKLLESACVFHDFGKILMPKEILNKPGKLTNEELEIMDMHAQLGYELLSTTSMNKRILDCIKNHHTPTSENADILVDILSVADKYSALREQRSYKQAYSVSESLNILDQKAKSGEVSTEVVRALRNSIVSSLSA